MTGRAAIGPALATALLLAACGDRDAAAPPAAAPGAAEAAAIDKANADVAAAEVASSQPSASDLPGRTAPKTTPR